MTCLLPLLLASLALSSADNPLSSIKTLAKPLAQGGDAVKSIAKKTSSAVTDNAVTNNATDLASSFGRGVQKEIQTVKQPIDETIAYVGSSQCSNVKKILGVAYESYEGDKEPDLEQLTLEYRDPTLAEKFVDITMVNLNSGLRMIFNITTAAARIPLEFNPAQKLFIFIHGFTDDPSRSSFGTISKALLSQGNCNVLALDGSSLIKWLYLRSSTYVRFMGERLGEVLAAMVQKGVNPSAIHIIGHSLGSHVSAFTGKQFANLTGFKVGRITGLDPAGPCFSHVDPELRLKATDADFVDVIHTDAGVYGLDEAVGQVDYYPNSGSEQPNCLLQTCSHSRAWEYFAESVTRPDAFPALKCDDWDAFKSNKCENDVSPMGYASKPGTKGKYFLQTGEDSPYGLGKEGLTWKNNEGIIKNVAAHVFG